MSMLYSSPAGLKAVQSLGHHFNPSKTLEDKLGLAGSSYELVASIPCVVAYLASKGTWDAIEEHEQILQTTLLTHLNSRPEITIIGEKSGDSKKRVCTIAFLVKGWKSQDFVEKVDELSKGEMGIRWGGFYSVRLLDEVFGLGKDGIVRVSMVHYNTGKLCFNNASFKLTDIYSR
jgi:selenocysteine lyase/cysteine desulfurase